MNLPPWARFPSNQKMKINPESDWTQWLAGLLFSLGLLIAVPAILLALPFWIVSYWLVAQDD